MKTALLLSLFLTTTAFAEAGVTVHLGGISKHTLGSETYKVGGKDKKFESNHKLVALEYKKVIAGGFVNSYGVDSQFVGYVWSKEFESVPVEVSAVTGLVYGYGKGYKSKGSKKILPMVVPAVHVKIYENEHFKVKVGAMQMMRATAATLKVEF